ncbi:hypothetical protein ArV1_047 [Arthrobacter phage vB_ArtM-ArV1]|uniref:Uncharacterized protein n=1 Tax=Arthrobacter phage vB_ArtM-ArV1 TaxID=1566993 RepID=A0A0A7HE63_9CAUD|nr:hypothetical protein ArV1_047 [Arthrobacter phage vB_ArtM-ArV1]AIZ01735.1 hypothetical protein ArV1_047 [Arthrobacter phage vB_ArtM-ArV1]
MRITHKDTKEFKDVELASGLHSMTVETANGARITIVETPEGLSLHEGSHRSLRVSPIASNVIAVAIRDPFIETAAPMTQVANEDALALIPGGSKLYSIRTKTLWDWWGVTSPLVASNDIGEDGNSHMHAANFWKAEAPLLLAAKPDND